MSNSLSDQLLKAGLITQDQIEKADQDKQKKKEQARAKFKKKNGNPVNKAKSQPAQQKPAKKQGKQPSDLAKFYQQRNQAEQAERAAEEKRKREAAERRRKTRKQIRQLIQENIKNTEDASIRYNFVVGETVKYLFVTDDQQKLIASGELSITFMDGKRCLIPTEVGEQILALDPEKVVVRFNPDEADPMDDFPMPDPGETSSETAESKAEAVPADDDKKAETNTDQPTTATAEQTTG
ncbi:MAG: DUF2058 family protein [Thiolinea sp.]